MLRKWRNETIKSAGVLFAGGAVNALSQLVITLLLAKELPPAIWGGIAVIISYTITIEALFATKSWQLTSSHAFRYLETSPRRFSAHFSVLFSTECATNALAATLALLLLPLAVRTLRLPDEFFVAGSLYAMSILFRFSGSAAAILRLMGKYHWQAIHSATLGASRLAVTSITLVTSPTATSILLALSIVESVWHIGLTILGWREIKNKHVTLHDLSKNIFRRMQNQNIKLLLISHLNNAIKNFTKDIDIIFISSIIGPEPAGQIKVYKSILRATFLVSDPLSNSYFATIIKRNNKSKTTRIQPLRNLIKIGLATSSTVVFFISATIYFAWPTEYSIPSPFSSGYFASYAIGIWIAITCFSLPVASLAMNRYAFALQVNTLVAFGYLAMLILFTAIWGPTGAGLAFAISRATWATFYLASLRQEL